MLRATSRTFALGIERLPGKLAKVVTVAYLLFRVSDYLEDSDELPTDKKVSLLGLWDKILTEKTDVSQLTALIEPPNGSNPDAIVAWNAALVLEALYSLPRAVQLPIIRNVRETTKGMARWVARGPLVQDENDMDDYMHEVAGRVGYLLTELFSWYSLVIRLQKEMLMPLAREFGLALQTVNIIRGLREDFERGWIYVPDSFCESLHVSREDVFRPENIREGMQVLEKLADKADQHLLSAMKYLKALPPWQHSIRLFCAYPLMFAVRTLAISRANQAVLNGEVKITREEVKRIVRDTTLWGWSNPWLDNYYRKLSTASAQLA
jgi:farnesyl-diphosphate farnesyltransferase